MCFFRSILLPVFFLVLSGTKFNICYLLFLFSIIIRLAFKRKLVVALGLATNITLFAY